MTKYIVTLETREFGALGVFEETHIKLEANDRTHAIDMALALCRRNNLEPRFVLKITGNDNQDITEPVA